MSLLVLLLLHFKICLSKSKVRRLNKERQIKLFFFFLKFNKFLLFPHWIRHCGTFSRGKVGNGKKSEREAETRAVLLCQHRCVCWAKFTIPYLAPPTETRKLKWSHSYVCNFRTTTTTYWLVHSFPSNTVSLALSFNRSRRLRLSLSPICCVAAVPCCRCMSVIQNCLCMYNADMAWCALAKMIQTFSSSELIFWVSCQVFQCDYNKKVLNESCCCCCSAASGASASMCEIETKL